ncbi:MAG TPA: hypothetical protein VFJ30_06900 [Phycisphaerae bacterium]|nr:hypothetical protein [Phycisphaerae bacterium]
MSDGIESNDHRRRRCPMLGHDLTFAYCRAPAKQLPCRKILDCWFETFDVRAFLGEHFTDEQIRQALAPPVDKMTTLIDLIQRARESTT